ncbi:hypothetical protein AKO1_012851 [Acrasis kona]|uniref:Major facilitator superfamily (MFS) profile domain-containing protein n=1 Tax=Acrasis kona TaxID=1008807 RepID=A0AAW2YW90_9EUKA
MDNRTEDIKTWKTRFLFILERRNGASNINIFSYYLSVIIMMSSWVFMGSTMPFVLEVYCKTPNNEKGRVIGDMNFYAEIVLLLLGWTWGSLSDTIGRNLLYVFGFSFTGLGIALLPVANSYGALVIVRLICALGTSALLGIYLATIADYVTDEDRGKAAGLMGLSLNIGSLFSSFVLINLPLWMSGGGRGILTEIQSGYISFTIVGILMLLGGLNCLLFLKDVSSPPIVINSEIVKTTEKKGLAKFFLQYLKGIKAAKDPIVALSFATAFISRMDVATLAYNSLWMQQELDEAGYSRSEALSITGLVSGISGLLTIFTAPTIGYMADKVDRTILLGCVSCFCIITFSAVAIIPNLIGWWVYVWFACMNIGHIGITVAGNALIAGAAPDDARGSVMGLFNLLANVGVLFATKIGGHMFDSRHSYPYYFVSGVNLILTTLCIITAASQWIFRKKERLIEDVELGDDESNKDRITEEQSNKEGDQRVD